MDDSNVDHGSGGGLGQTRVLLAVVQRRWWLVLLGALLGGISGLAFSLAQPPVYESSAMLYVTSGSSSESAASAAYQNSMASQQRVSSYADLAKSDVILEQAIEAAGLDMSVPEARSSVSASSKPTTVLLTVSGRGGTPAEAAGLVNGVASAMSDYVTSLERPAAGGDPLAKLTIVTPAVANSSPVSPHTYRNAVLGLLGGGVLGICYLMARWRLDSKIHDAAGLAEVSPAPVIGVVPMEAGLERRSMLDFHSGASAAAEGYRRLRTNLAFVNVDSSARRILVTSSVAGEGKTTTAMNLSAALAESGRSVALVDADLRRPTIGGELGLNAGVGLTNYLRGDASLADLLQPSGVAGLDVLTSGSVPPNPAELLGSQKARGLVAELSEQYDFVIVDSPPIVPVTDALVIAQYVDGVLLVVRAEESSKSNVADAVSRLDLAQAHVVGVMLNGVSEKARGYTYYTYTPDPDHSRSPSSGVSIERLRADPIAGGSN